MTENERTELEVCIYVLHSLVADINRIALKNNVNLDENNELGASYRYLLNYVNNLRKTTSYKDVIEAKRNIATMKEKLAKMEADSYG